MLDGSSKNDGGNSLKWNLIGSSMAGRYFKGSFAKEGKFYFPDLAPADTPPLISSTPPPSQVDIFINQALVLVAIDNRRRLPS